MKTRIREVAQEKGITQKMLAEKLGVNINTVKWYYKTETIGLNKLEIIANAIGCEVWQLLITEDEALSKMTGYVSVGNSDELIPINKLRYRYT